jgi:hypothetical protein
MFHKRKQCLSIDIMGWGVRVGGVGGGVGGWGGGDQSSKKPIRLRVNENISSVTSHNLLIYTRVGGGWGEGNVAPMIS